MDNLTEELRKEIKSLENKYKGELEYSTLGESRERDNRGVKSCSTDWDFKFKGLGVKYSFYIYEYVNRGCFEIYFYNDMPNYGKATPHHIDCADMKESVDFIREYVESASNSAKHMRDFSRGMEKRSDMSYRASIEILEGKR